MEICWVKIFNLTIWRVWRLSRVLYYKKKFVISIIKWCTRQEERLGGRRRHRAHHVSALLPASHYFHIRVSYDSSHFISLSLYICTKIYKCKEPNLTKFIYLKFKPNITIQMASTLNLSSCSSSPLLSCPR